MWLGDDEAHDKVLGIVADILPIPLMKDNGAGKAFFKQVWEIVTLERGVPREKGIRDNPDRPHIRRLAMT
jgi:hypothetical protein